MSSPGSFRSNSPPAEEQYGYYEEEEYDEPAPPPPPPPPPQRPSKKILAFDLYGTLLDTSSIVSVIESVLPDYNKHLAESITTDWRRSQLEYTWRLNSMGWYSSPHTALLQVVSVANLYARRAHNRPLP